jgi:hypothetical protein
MQIVHWSPLASIHEHVFIFYNNVMLLLTLSNIISSFPFQCQAYLIKYVENILIRNTLIKL